LPPSGDDSAVKRLWRWRPVSSRAIPGLILTTTFIILMSLAISTARNVSRGDALAFAGATESVSRAALVAQSLLDRHLMQVDGQLSSLTEWLERGFISPADPERASLALEQLSSHSYTHRNLMLADATGEIWASGVAARRGHSLPLPRGLLERAAQEAQVTLHGPLRSPETGLSMLLLLRPVGQDAAGRALLAAAEIPTAMITAVLTPMVNPPDLRVRLENREGLVLAAGPGQTYLVGQALPPDRAREGRVERSPNRQGPGHVFATARPIMLPGLLAVAVLPEASALNGWPALRRNILAGSGIAALLLVALAAALFFIAWHSQRANALRECADARLRAAIESLPDGFVLWDAEDRLVICNSRYRSFYGPVEKMLVPGLRFEDLARAWVAHDMFTHADPDPEARVARVMETHRNPGAPRERDMTDGRCLRIAQSRMPDGGIVVILTDITALKHAMAELGAARDAADRATAAKSHLLAHVSHELRTPLTSLLRLADALQRDTALAATQRHQAGLVGATARHLLALANEVLDLAAMEADSLTLNLAPAAPRAIFQEALAMVQPLAEAKRVRLDFTAQGLPPHIEADAMRLRQMVLNVLSNAVKFTPEGSLVRLTAAAADGQLRFAVQDQGAGVPEALRAQIFEDFTRLDVSQPDGTGLGLSITARLTQLMGGKIRCLDATPPPGARFEVDLPLRLAGPPAPVPDDLPRRGLRLLAVDDAPSNLAVLRALLAQSDLELETVTEGAAALEAVEIAAREGRPFDVVLMDVMMPGMDGKETTRRLRAMPGTIGRMPVIAVTASAFPDDLAEARAAGMDGHVIKPVDRALLLRALAEAVARPVSPPPGTQEALDSLRPMLLAELDLRLTQLERALREGTPLTATVHALAGTIGHLGAPQQVTRTRRVLQALREEDPDGPKLARALLDELRHSFPEAAGA
jgi:signal transduction histidine kinase/CheY-like chemotaxis protein